MTESRPTRATVSMKGGGYYSENTRGAKDVIDRTAALALDALSKIDLAGDPSAFSIADFGAADGGTSIDLMRKLVSEVRARAPKRTISVTYTDLPRNDFSALFTMLDGQRPGVSSYALEHSNVYVYASGTSFYRQILLPQTLDLGFSATAMHWLSGHPGTISNHVHAVGAKGAERDAFSRSAREDWETLLLHRARELKPGGRLVMSNFCIDESGRYLGNTDGVNMFDTFDRLWRELAVDGTISDQEYRNTAFPQYYRNVEEYSAPLIERSNPVYAAGLRLESIETGIVPCPYAAAFRRDADAAAFAAAYVPTLRSWSENVFFSGLDESRSEAERHAIVERFFQSYIDLVRQNPAGHAMDYVHAYMSVRKVND